MWYARDRDPWATLPSIAAKAVILSVIGGIAMLIAGLWVGLIFLLLIPIWVYAGVRGWRQGDRF